VEAANRLDALCPVPPDVDADAVELRDDLNPFAFPHRMWVG
jgi:hypothetical protein